MKLICLTQGKFALVDDEDFERVNMFNWYYNTGYAMRCITVHSCKQQVQFLHKFVMCTDEKLDHIDRNSLNCQKYNLRVCSHNQNMMNLSFRKGKISKGVYQVKSLRWVAQIRVNKKAIYLGTFDSKIEAMDAYDDMAIHYFGEFAATNKDLNKEIQ